MAKKKSKKIVSRVIKYAFYSLAVIFFGTIGIDAVDNYDNMSQSIAGRLLVGKSEGPCPADMVFVQSPQGDFCADRYEASPSKKCPKRNPASNRDSQINLEQSDCLPVSEDGSAPWANISQNLAARACAKAGKRLLSNFEWTQAALGTPDSDSVTGKDQCQVANNWDTRPGPAGSAEKCQSYAGAYDMIGNVWEWVGGAVEDGVVFERKLPAAGYITGVSEADGLPTGTVDDPQDPYYSDYLWIKNAGSRAIARGGYWNNKQEAGQYAHYIVSAPEGYENGIGFRCGRSLK